jgi:hypothetical protein
MTEVDGTVFMAGFVVGALFLLGPTIVMIGLKW